MTSFDESNVRGLRLTHFEQLANYIDWAEDSRVYYGQKHHFDKRHSDLREWVKGMIDAKKMER